MSSKYKILYTVNLTSTSDPEFKIAQLLQADDAILFDMRQTSKGRKSKIGICLNIPEFIWLKRVLDNKNRLSTLEHGMRLIRVEKSIDKVEINVQKADGTTRKMALKQVEYNNLMSQLPNIEKATFDLNCDYKFSDSEYVKERFE